MKKTIALFLVVVLASLAARLLYRNVVVTDAFFIRETGLVHVTYPMKYREVYGEFLVRRGWTPVKRQDFPFAPMAIAVFRDEKVMVTFPQAAYCFGNGRDGLKDFGQAGHGSATIEELADVVAAIERVLIKRDSQCPSLERPKGSFVT